MHGLQGQILWSLRRGCRASRTPEGLYREPSLGADWKVTSHFVSMEDCCRLERIRAVPIWEIPGKRVLNMARACRGLSSFTAMVLCTRWLNHPKRRGPRCASCCWLVVSWPAHPVWTRRTMAGLAPASSISMPTAPWQGEFVRASWVSGFTVRNSAVPTASRSTFVTTKGNGPETWSPACVAMACHLFASVPQVPVRV